MITVEILGGLGNQLFRYAAGRSLAQKHKTGLILDVSHYEKYKLRTFELGCFNIKAEVRNSTDIFTRIARGALKFFPGQKTYREKYYHFDPVFLDLPDGTYLKGYFQSEKYFLPIKDIIRKDIFFKKELNDESGNYLAKIRKTEVPVSIHFRITDYLKSELNDQYHYVLSPKYYNQAILMMERRLVNPVYFIFSDDINYVKRNFSIPKNTLFIDREIDVEAWEDLKLMSFCKHHIIANSSFSWWAAWLNGNTKKIIIAPKKWFDQGPADSEDLIPENWVKI